jgi:hypothetical protein
VDAVEVAVVGVAGRFDSRPVAEEDGAAGGLVSAGAAEAAAGAFDAPSAALSGSSFFRSSLDGSSLLQSDRHK